MPAKPRHYCVCGGEQLRLCLRPIAFGNALGESLGAQNTSGFATRERPPTTFFKPGELEKVDVPSIEDILNPAVQNATGSNGSWGEYDPYASKYPSRFRFRAEPASSAKWLMDAAMATTEKKTPQSVENKNSPFLPGTEQNPLTQTVEVSAKKLTPEEKRAMDERYANDVSWQMSQPTWSFRDASRKANERDRLVALEKQKIAIANGPRMELDRIDYAARLRAKNTLEFGFLGPIFNAPGIYTRLFGGNEEQVEVANEFGGAALQVAGAFAGIPNRGPIYVGPRTFNDPFTPLGRPIESYNTKNPDIDFEYGTSSAGEFFKPYRSKLNLGTNAEITPTPTGSTISVNAEKIMLENGTIAPAPKNRYPENELRATYNAASGDLFVDWMGASPKKTGLGTEMLSKAIEINGPTKVNSISGVLDADNNHIYNMYFQEYGMTGKDAMLKTPFAKTLRSLGYDADLRFQGGSLVGQRRK